MVKIVTKMRRKSACSKWTLVLFLVLLCPYVYSRPQDNASPEGHSVSENVVKPTQNPIRYRYKNDSFIKLDIPVILDKNSFKQLNSSSPLIVNKYFHTFLNDNTTSKRRGRLLSKIVTNSKTKDPTINTDLLKKRRHSAAHSENKPTIKKVITKWTDNVKYEGLNLNYESTPFNEQYATLNSIDGSEYYKSREDIVDHSTEDTKMSNPKSKKNKIKKTHKKPKPDYSEETQVYPENIYVTNDYHHPSTRPIYIFNTPSPTPIISNVGNPKPWSRPNLHSTYHTLNTQRPVLVTKPPKNNYYNSVYNNYPHHSGHDFEVTTFQPTNAYTDRIIIRPEEYSASPEECPTIFLTLNNTFQGQGKEACPDLNIAVNTNVINKNVVVESDEEEGEGGIFADPFGLPFEDESGDETASTDDIFDSDENQEQINSESASIEGLSYTNYNAATDGDSAEPGGVGSASQVLSSYQKPELPNDEDDSFSISSFYNFFKPAINALGWLSTINPFGFGLLSFFLAPIVFLFAGTSGIAALFAPWAFSARESPKVVQIHRPYWHWDDEIKTWHLHSFPDNRNWNPSLSRSSKELENTNNDPIKPTLFYRMKEWMKIATHKLKTNNDKKANRHHRKNKRKKRETWTKRKKY